MTIRTILALLTCFALGACSLGTHYTSEGPHPHMNVAGSVHVGPIEILHTPVSNADPVTDLTVVTLNAGVRLGPLQPIIGVGWQLGRSWGACDSDGFNCEKNWTNGYVLSAGLTYRASPLRIDLRAFSYDNSPVGANVNLPLDIEAFTLMFGFDL